MENIRAFTIIHNLEGAVEDLRFWPQDIMENESSSERIQREGFTILFASHLPFDEIRRLLSSSSFIKTLEITDMKEEDEPSPSVKKEKKEKSDVSKKAGKKELGNTTPKTVNSLNVKQSTINVGVAKLDQLMDLMGELVIYEAMVTQNPELDGLELKNFHNSARQLKKVIHELQDVVMSIRMVPLSVVFRSMNRIVRDMCKKLGKDVQLQIAGEETEVDKNIIDHIGDPLMHIIRNAVDHGIEPPGERCRDGKSERGSIQLEAKNEGGEVIVRIQDDGRGLNKEKILAKAQEKGLVHKAVDELTDSEIFSFILLPGFSTKEEVSEYSGRGVGMDVVMKDIEKVRGSILIDSVLGKGTFITIKIPLTLAIIDGMTVRVGKGRYTIPIRAIREVFKGKKSEIIKDADGHEMVFIRDQWCPVLRLHQLYGVETKITEITNGILLVIENESCSFCLFADELLEKQQVVIKALPKFIKKVPGITGCTLLGDGSISLILDTEGIYRHVMKERR